MRNDGKPLIAQHAFNPLANLVVRHQAFGFAGRAAAEDGTNRPRITHRLLEFVPAAAPRLATIPSPARPRDGRQPLYLTRP